MDLLSSLQQVMIVSPGRTVSEYKTKLRESGFESIRKKQLNSLLYGHQEIFEIYTALPGAPRWFLRNRPVTSDLSEPLPRSLQKPRSLNSLSLRSTRLPLYDWQQEALTAWEECGFRGVVEAVTGAGKTRIGIKAAIDEINRGGCVLVIVPSLELLKQWEKNLKEYLPKVQIGLLGGGAQADFNNYKVLISTINSARKRNLFPPRRGKGLLIADECHRYGTECSTQALDERFTRRLGLSATYERNDNGKADWLEPYFNETCYTLDYRTAIENGAISRFSVALVGAAFSDSEKYRYETYSKKLAKLRTDLIDNYDVPEEPFGEFIKQVSLMEKVGYGAGTFAARSYLANFKQRQKLLAESPAKIEALLKLKKALNQANRTLIFTETVKSAELIAEVLRTEGIDAQAVHSGIKGEERPKIMSEFEKGMFNVLVAPRILDEGIDVPEADLAIIVAASRTRRQMIQRMGRILRRKADGREARFALLYIENTAEDPVNGAHDHFLNEITEVAESVKKFKSSTTIFAIARFMTNSGCYDLSK